MGEKGSAVITSEEIIHTPKANIEPVDTNGAGDMFAGSFMHAYLNGHSIKECSVFANYASSMVVTNFGPRVSDDKYREILNKLKKS